MPSLVLPMTLPMSAVGDPEVFHDFKVGQFPVNGTFARSSTVNGWTAGPVLTEFASGAPAFVIDPATGQALGYRALAGSTNKCTNHNLNPDAALTNISASAGTLERVDDSANLPLSNQFDGNAFHLNNGTGGSVIITVTGQCGNTNAHSIGVLCRFTGTAPTVQLTGGDGAATCNNDYDETKSEGITPSATTDQWQLVVPDGTEVWFVSNQPEEGTFISSWIKTEGATGSTAADDATEPMSQWFNKNEGTFIVEVYKEDIEERGIILSILPDGTTNSLLIEISGGDFRASDWNGPSESVSLAGAASVKGAMTYSGAASGGGKLKTAANGILSAGSNSFDLSGDQTDLVIGNLAGSTDFYFNGAIARIEYYPRSFTDAELQEVTS